MTTDQAAAAFDHALALHRAGKVAEAEVAYRQVIALDPQHVVARLNRGVALRRLGRLEEALASYDEAVAAHPTYAEAHSNRANVLMDLGRPDDALAGLDRALELKPALAEAHSSRANLLNRQQRFDEAQAAAARALELNPALVEAHVYRGDAHYGLLRPQEAIDDYDAALRLDPRHAGACYNRGLAYAALGRLDAAEASFGQAIALRPDYAEAHWNRAMALLLARDFARGWEEYEWRLKGERGRRHNLSGPQPLWIEREAILGKSVLVRAEQGIGDQVMFASMLPDLARDAGAVTCLCDARLLGLFENAFPAIDFLAEEARPSASAFDMVVAMGGLGRWYRREVEAFDGEPYLALRAQVVSAWRERLGASQGRRRIGFTWRGGTPETNGAGRSMSLETLAPLLGRADCEFVSLQHGDVAEEIARANAALAWPIRQFPADDLRDFEQLAGLIASLDLVISVQTSVIHVSGAVGAPCWVMVPSRPAWRYGVEGETLPWYRSVRLFRQAEHDRWDEVVARICARLDALG